MDETTDPATDTWPPPSGLTTPLVPRNAVILPTHGSAHIDAPAALVFAILTDTSTYPRWCTFCPRVTIRSQPPPEPSTSTQLRLNTRLTFHVIMDAAKPNATTATDLRVTDVSTPAAPSSYIAPAELEAEPTYTADLSSVYRISWTTEGGFVARGLRTERFHEVIVRGERACEVRTWEGHGGQLARVVKWMYAKVLMQKFAEWCVDLKGEAEKLFAEQQQQQQEGGKEGGVEAEAAAAAA